MLDLFDNPVGYRTSLAKSPAFRCFLVEVVQKLKFPNNSIVSRRNNFSLERKEKTFMGYTT
jgi:hypothetical protein